MTITERRANIAILILNKSINLGQMVNLLADPLLLWVLVLLLLLKALVPWEQFKCDHLAHLTRHSNNRLQLISKHIMKKLIQLFACQD